MIFNHKVDLEKYFKILSKSFDIFGWCCYMLTIAYTIYIYSEAIAHRDYYKILSYLTGISFS